MMLYLNSSTDPLLLFNQDQYKSLGEKTSHAFLEHYYVTTKAIFEQQNQNKM